MKKKSLYTKNTLNNEPTIFRIEAVISDGMWYSLPKWQKLSNVTEEELEFYVKKALSDGVIVQSPTGSRSYRMTFDSIKKWYKENDFDIYDDNVQLLDFSFPPRIWNGRTEPEGFLEAPVREIGIVSFIVDSVTAEKIAQELKGIAKVRENEPGKYKAYGLNHTYIKDVVTEVIESNPAAKDIDTKVYSRQVSKRREMIDFDPKFAEGLVNFYKEFGKTLVKQSLKTIKIFISSTEEQNAQVLMWILEAIEKFDESASVPFSGYLDTVLKRWPYNLPNQFLGKELSQFQKDRAKAIDLLKNEFGDDDTVFSHEDIAAKMGLDKEYFNDMEEKHKAWLGAKNAKSLLWEDKGEEKTDLNTESVLEQPTRTESDRFLSNKISLSAIESSLETGCFDDSVCISCQIDSGDISPEVIATLDEEYVLAFGRIFGIKKF